MTDTPDTPQEEVVEQTERDFNPPTPMPTPDPSNFAFPDTETEQSNTVPVVDGVIPGDEVPQDPDYFDGLDEEDE